MYYYTITSFIYIYVNDFLFPPGEDTLIEMCIVFLVSMTGLLLASTFPSLKINFNKKYTKFYIYIYIKFCIFFLLKFTRFNRCLHQGEKENHLCIYNL